MKQFKNECENKSIMVKYLTFYTPKYTMVEKTILYVKIKTEIFSVDEMNEKNKAKMEILLV